MKTVIRILLLLISLSGIILAQSDECPEQPDVAVIVVASVFGTLGVVLLVVGIILLYLWRRNKGMYEIYYYILLWSTKYFNFI